MLQQKSFDFDEQRLVPREGCHSLKSVPKLNIWQSQLCMTLIRGQGGQDMYPQHFPNEKQRLESDVWSQNLKIGRFCDLKPAAL